MSPQKYKSFGERFTQILAMDSKNNQEWAERLGLKSGETIRVWKKGENLPSGENLLKLHEEIGVSIEWLLLGKGQPYGQEGENKANSDLERARLEIEFKNKEVERCEQIIQSKNEQIESLKILKEQYRCEAERLLADIENIKTLDIKKK